MVLRNYGWTTDDSAIQICNNAIVAYNFFANGVRTAYSKVEGGVRPDNLLFHHNTAHGGQFSISSPVNLVSGLVDSPQTFFSHAPLAQTIVDNVFPINVGPVGVGRKSNNWAQLHLLLGYPALGPNYDASTIAEVLPAVIDAATSVVPPHMLDAACRLGNGTQCNVLVTILCSNLGRSWGVSRAWRHGV